MNCPKCDVRLKTRQVYSAGDSAKTARLECSKCGRVYTQVSFIVGEAASRGDGAYALAQRIEKRPDPPKLTL